MSIFNGVNFLASASCNVLQYLGVATFCRVKSAFFSNEVALPLEAEEGFTGLLECPRKREIIRDFMLEAPFEEEDLEITDDDLLKVDSEGRCLITDHGHFGESNHQWLKL